MFQIQRPILGSECLLILFTFLLHSLLIKSLLVFHPQLTKIDAIKWLYRTFLMVQWIRIHLPMKGTWVWPLVWEDSTCHGATKPGHHSYCACKRQQLNPTRPGARARQQEKPLQWEACAQQRRPAQPKLNKTKKLNFKMTLYCSQQAKSTIIQFCLWDPQEEASLRPLCCTTSIFSSYRNDYLSSIVFLCLLLEKETATHSSTLAWKISRTEKPDRL